MNPQANNPKENPMTTDPMTCYVHAWTYVDDRWEVCSRCLLARTHTTPRRYVQPSPPPLRVEQNYFPADEFGAVYCEHLFKQLGPCEQCDNVDYLAWCEADYERAQREYPDTPDGYDSRGPGDFAVDEFAHIPLVEIPGARSYVGPIFAYSNTSPTATLLVLNEQGTPVGAGRYSPAEVAVRNCVKRVERLLTSDPAGLDRWLRIATMHVRLRREGLL